MQIIYGYFVYERLYQNDYLLYFLVVIAAIISGDFSVLNFKFIPNLLNNDVLEIAAAMMQFPTAAGMVVGVYVALSVSFIDGTKLNNFMY